MGAIAFQHHSEKIKPAWAGFVPLCKDTAFLCLYWLINFPAPVAAKCCYDENDCSSSKQAASFQCH
jgi:hypothetical protein